MKKKKLSIEDVLNLFEKTSTTQGYTSNPEFKRAIKLLLNFGANSLNYVGFYLSKNETVKNPLAWCILLQRIIAKFKINNFGIGISDFQSLRRWCVNKYGDCLKEYDEYYKKAQEFMDGFANDKLSWNNSSHRQQAVQKYQQCLGFAEKLFDEEKIKSLKRQIHFIQSA